MKDTHSYKHLYVSYIGNQVCIHILDPIRLVVVFQTPSRRSKYNTRLRATRDRSIYHSSYCTEQNHTDISVVFLHPYCLVKCLRHRGICVGMNSCYVLRYVFSTIRLGNMRRLVVKYLTKKRIPPSIFSTDLGPYGAFTFNKLGSLPWRHLGP